MTEKELIEQVTAHDKSFVICIECASCGELMPIETTDDMGDCADCVRQRGEMNS